MERKAIQSARKGGGRDWKKEYLKKYFSIFLATSTDKLIISNPLWNYICGSPLITRSSLSIYTSKTHFHFCQCQQKAHKRFPEFYKSVYYFIPGQTSQFYIPFFICLFLRVLIFNSASCWHWLSHFLEKAFQVFQILKISPVHSPF